MRIAIIPARGGSKRIPRKNIRMFCGKPILHYSVQAALGSGLFDEVMVSTDDEQIAAVAKDAGAKVPFLRSAANSDDFSSTADVLIEVMDEYKRTGKHFSEGCCIYPTAPFVTAEKLRSGFELMQAANYDVVFAVSAFSYTIWRSLNRDSKGRMQMNWPENLTRRSQDLPTAYHDAGLFYWFKTQPLRQTHSLFGNNSGGIEVSELEMQDIDSETDWQIAELKYRLLYAE